ncbi:MAG: SUMF1/EgtB/PvdO family nonheme iron enzyme [Pseudomonadota bacterium]|nr:SUMF1/EgtB/PvdO family nonheme iron enzyme [Pseudomonadota bacterium]
MAEIRILHAQDTLPFACRVAAALAASGHSVIRTEAGGLDRPVRGAEPLIVVWSSAMLANQAAINEARAALAGRRLVPIAIGRIEPPASFAHLPPIDLAGWSGETDDSRWRFVCEEVELALRHQASGRAELYLDDEDDAPAEIDIDPPYIIPVRTIAAGAAGVALIAVAALVTASLTGGERNAAPGGQPSLVQMARAPAPAAEADEEKASPAQTGRREEDERRPSQELAAAPSQRALVLESMTPADDAGDIEAAPPQDFAAAEETPEEDASDVFADADRLTPPVSALADAGPAAEEDVAADTAQDDVEADAPSGPPPPLKLPPKPVDDFLGVVFRDCLDCPDMVEAPSGAFQMGAGEGDPARRESEGPAHVEVVAGFAISRREVTFAQWDACVAQGGCRAYAPGDEGFGRGARPVINVSYADAERYAQWLTAKTGHSYRLPTEAEWEYAARAGAETPYAGGRRSLSASHANYDGALKSDEAEPVSVRMTTPAGSYPANAFGLYDAEGNVWEWTADCWKPSHSEAASADCSARVVKGGSYDSAPAELRPAHRVARPETAREPTLGFRVARDLD